jgi:starch-binding outer membrane protein, SusD/RagB family
MKNIKKYILLAALMGCSDNLELLNPNVPTTDTFWQTEDQALAGVTAIYNSLIIDGTYMRMLPAAMDGRGDDIKGDSPWGDLVQMGNFTIPTTSGPVEWVWGGHYQLIWRANQVLVNVEDIEIDAELRRRLEGQAYFLRGLAYFNLANAFKEVPVVTTLPRDQSQYYPETASEDVVWGQIISDFQAAQERLPASYVGITGPDAGQRGRATQGAATGMLGKAYLYRQRWAEAATEFEKLISGSLAQYSLVPNYRDNFSPFTENNAESLFEVQFATREEVGGSDYNWGGNPTANWMQVSAQAVTYAADGKGFSDFLPTRGLYEAYKSERTVTGGLDPRLIATIASFEPEAGSVTIYGDPWPYGPDAIYPRKYTNDGFGYPHEYDINSGINYRVLRYADILLMYAEALNELNRTAEAYPYIQQVRGRAGLPDLALVKPNMSQQQMRDQIGHERYLEFAIEGQRINDIIRWGWLYDAEKLAMLRANDTDFNTWTPGNEYLPIPQRELDVNPNLRPNPSNE